MSNIAKYIRIFKVDPDDDFVTKRTAAIKVIEEGFKKKTVINDILKLANSLSVGNKDISAIDPEITSIVEKAIKKQSSSFVAEDEEQQIITCALISVNEYFSKISATSKNSLTVSDVLAIGIWSAFSFQEPISDKPKLNELIGEIVNAGRKVITSNSYTSRQRQLVNTPKPLQAPEDLTQVISSIKSIIPAIASLTTNAALDREEIDVLWWMLNDRSLILDIPFLELKPVEQAVLKGLEISSLLRRLGSDSHRNIATKALNKDDKFDATELLNEITDSSEKISDYLSKYKIINECPEIFPLMTILSKKDTNISGAKTKRTLSEWASRALVEGTMLNMDKFISDGK